MGDGVKVEVVQDAVRMTIRAFYSDYFIVVVDTILRERNYVSDDYLASKLRLPAKDVRQTLIHLKDQKLIRNQKREFHKKIPKNPNRTKRVQKEYWYVDYRSFIDMIKYRVDRIERELRDRVSAETAQHQVYHCPKCNTEYTALQVIELLDYQTNSFICNTPLGRKMTCNGVLEEEDIMGRRAELEGKQKRFERDLRPLREQIAQCDAMEIPVQPDEDVADIDPESIDAMDDNLGDGDNPDAMNVIIDIPDDHEQEDRGGASSTAPVQPKWFTGDDPDAGRHPVAIDTGEEEEAPAGADEDEAGMAYYTNYLSQHTEVNGTNAPAAEEEDVNGEQDEEAPAEEPLISVGDEMVPISEITAQHTERMTTEQYNAYEAKYHEMYG